MALVNPQIAMSFRPTTEYQPRNALAEYAQLQAIQAGRQAQELNALKMQEAQAALEERNALRSLNPSSEDYESQLFKVSPQLGIQFRREAATTAAQRAAQQKSEFDLTTARRKFAEDLRRGLSANPSDENIIAFGQDALLQNLYTPDQVKSEVSRLLALPVPDRVRILSQAGASAADLRPQVIGGRLVSSAGNVLYAAPSAIGAVEEEIATLKGQGVADTDPRIVARQGKIRQLSGAPGPTEIANIEAEIATLRGQGVADTDPRIVARQGKITQLSGGPAPAEIRTMESLGYPLTQAGYASFRAAQMRETPPALVPILRDGKPVLVSRDQAIGQTPFSPASVQVLGVGPQRETREPAARPPTGYRFTPTGDLEPIPGGPASPGLSPRDIQKREAAFPQATQSVNGFQTKSEQFIAELERLRDDPGLNQITGPIYGRTPSVSREGSRAQALYDKIFAKGGFQALQDMREASKTGGALGNVSNEEGRRLERSIVGGLDRTQNLADVQQGINDLIAEIRVSQSRVREAYDSTYEYRRQRGEGAAPGGRQLSPQDKQALDWANNNPRDPRAAQIKSRLGVQ